MLSANSIKPDNDEGSETWETEMVDEREITNESQKDDSTQIQNGQPGDVVPAIVVENVEIEKTPGKEKVLEEPDFIPEPVTTHPKTDAVETGTSDLEKCDTSAPATKYENSEKQHVEKVAAPSDEEESVPAVPMMREAPEVRSEDTSSSTEVHETSEEHVHSGGDRSSPISVNAPVENSEEKTTSEVAAVGNIHETEASTETSAHQKPETVAVEPTDPEKEPTPHSSEETNESIQQKPGTVAVETTNPEEKPVSTSSEMITESTCQTPETAAVDPTNAEEDSSTVAEVTNGEDPAVSLKNCEPLHSLCESVEPPRDSLSSQSLPPTTIPTIQISSPAKETSEPEDFVTVSEPGPENITNLTENTTVEVICQEEVNQNKAEVVVVQTIETVTGERLMEAGSPTRSLSTNSSVSILEPIEEAEPHPTVEAVVTSSTLPVAPEVEQSEVKSEVGSEVKTSSILPVAAEVKKSASDCSPETAKVSTESPPVKPRRSSLDSSPVPPPRRLSTVFTRSGTTTPVKKMSTSSYGTGKIFNGALPRNTRPPTREEAGKKKKKSMFSWLGGDSSKKKNKEVLDTVSEGLRKIYKQKLYPLEEHYKFHEFHSPALDDPDFDAKPMILLVGQYSTGKTTFIRHLLEQDFPGIRIGPEPTTDRFIAVMHSEEDGVIPGNALVVDAKKQFRALSGFGNAFLNRFQCSTLPNQVLESVTIVDTPGILSGEKQRIDRGYDFTGVLEWFAERVDRIILLFDAHKLDISDEFKRCIEALAGNEDKIRIVLNKSDMVDHQQLMRVYGALMWSLGKVFRTPEVSRVYIGSFWDHPLHYDVNRRLFQDEQQDLFQDLQALPRNAALRKLNDLIKRARLAKVHAYIIAELRKQMPSMIGKDKKKKELIQNLDKIFEQLQREHNISPGDFPDVQKMREKLQNQDFTKFNPIKPKLLDVVDGMLASDIARLMAQIPKEEQVAFNNGTAAEQPSVKGGAFSQAQEAETPFGFGRGEGFDKGADENEWVVSRERTSADTTFESLGPSGGFLSGRVAKEHMVKSKLPNAVLGKIWKLADVDKDGQLDGDEFALANYLINLKLEGHELPTELPAHLIPPSKRNVDTVYPTLEEEE